MRELLSKMVCEYDFSNHGCSFKYLTVEEV